MKNVAILILSILGFAFQIQAQNVFPTTGNVGIGTTTPGIWFNSQAFEIKHNRPVLSFNSTGALGTIVFTNDAINSTRHGEFHFNHIYTSANPSESLFNFHAYPTGTILSLRADGKVGIGTSSPNAPLSFANTGGNKIDLFYNTANGGDRYGLQIQSNELRIHSGAAGASSGGITFGKQSTSTFTENVRFTNSGNVGIGTTNPSSKLEVSGDIKIHSGTSGTSSKIIFKTTDNGDLSKFIGSESYWTVVGVHGNEGLKIKDNSGDILMQINGVGGNNGFVGIGTTTPDSKLSVNGNIHAKEVKVDLIGWSDFVFEPDYDLLSLKETEEYIKENHHLPEIPSAAEVEENGIQLGEMNAKLLQKIEALTLYLIEQDKTLVSQNKSIEELQKQVVQLINNQ